MGRGQDGMSFGELCPALRVAFQGGCPGKWHTSNKAFDHVLKWFPFRIMG